MNILIRAMIETDIADFHKAFALQGWEKTVSHSQKYFAEQESGKRKLYVAQAENQVCGYATLLDNDEYGPFANKYIPTICDFNVLEIFQKNGIGNAILDKIENDVKVYSKTVCLGVGLHSGYGAAQRMYVKRGYIPDGSGVWYNNKNLEQYADCKNDDDLILYLSKDLTSTK